MGDYSRKLDRYTDATVTKYVAAADDLSTTPLELIAAPDSTQNTIYVQKILVSVTTDAAQSLIFQDGAGTPVVFAKTKVSPGLGPILFDFGPDGLPLTQGKALNLKNSAAGLACAVTVTAYSRRTGTGAS